MTKKTLSALILSTAFLSAATHAEDDMKKDHAMKGSMRSMPSQNGMMKMSPEMMAQKLRAKQNHMLQMHDYSNRILNEKDPAKKQQLKDEQLELMKAHHQKMMKMRHMMKMHRMMMQK